MGMKRRKGLFEDSLDTSERTLRWIRKHNIQKIPHTTLKNLTILITYLTPTRLLILHRLRRMRMKQQRLTSPSVDIS